MSPVPLLSRSTNPSDTSQDVHQVFGIHVTAALVVVIVAGSLLLLGLLGWFIFGKGATKVKALAAKCNPQRKHQRKITPTLVVQKPRRSECQVEREKAPATDDLATLAAEDDESEYRLPPIMEEESTHGTVVGRQSL